MPPTERETPGSPAVLRRVAAALVAVEAFAVLAYGAFVAVETVFGDAVERDAAVFLAVLILALGVFLALCARGVVRAERWVRAPVLLWQVLQIVISPISDGSRWWIALPMVATAIVTGVLVTRSDVIPAERGSEE